MPEGLSLPSPSGDDVPEAATELEDVPDEEVAAERHLIHRVIVGIAVGIPVGALLLAGIVLVATRGADITGDTAAAMGAVVGVFAGAFFGALSGFLLSAHELDEADHHTYHLA